MGDKIELYEPSNGSEGDWFMSSHCFKCAKYPHSYDAKNQCAIFLRTQVFGKDEPEYPTEWRMVDGKPTCTAFKDRDEYNAERRAKRKCQSKAPLDVNTADLFAENQAKKFLEIPDFLRR